ncbi:MAG: RNA methyltransferase [Opitutaceae bacterium]|nr:RNA methyltransferase [Opitutaceae bacterium]
MSVERITSLQNPRVKQLVKLRDRRARDEEGLFLVEGYREVKRALAAGVKPVELYYGPDWFLGENEPALIEEAQRAGTPVFELSKEAFAKVSYRDRPDGLLAVAPQWQRTLDDLDKVVAGLGEAGSPGSSTVAKAMADRATPATRSATPFLLVIEAIEKPGNLGTILRSADAAGVDAVIVCDPVTDIFNPNVVRSSTGVLFSMPVVMAAGPDVRAWLRVRGIRAVATTPAAPALYTDSDLRGPLAIIMGSEQYGLSEFWLKESDGLVRIPMAGQADSLNVAMATIITLFEAVRQRG